MQIEQEKHTVIVESKPTQSQKIFTYRETGIRIGKGKHGPVDLIIVDGNLRALKRISKASINSAKRI